MTFLKVTQRQARLSLRPFFEIEDGFYAVVGIFSGHLAR